MYLHRVPDVVLWHSVPRDSVQPKPDCQPAAGLHLHVRRRFQEILGCKIVLQEIRFLEIFGIEIDFGILFFANAKVWTLLV